MTYGWMLLGVAMVSGAIFATVGGKCVKSSSGLSAPGVILDDFSTTSSGEMVFELRNGESDRITVENISISSRTTGETVSISDSFRISSLDSETVSFGNVYFREGNGCNVIDVKIKYSTPGIENQIKTGTLSSNIKMGAASAPQPPSNIQLN
ncbi:MAG: hypothetical protein ABEJ93_04465 [Candidatus Nanohalobium sp.]